ncbi:hypothetical protein GLOTRDRAFT_26774, partial [Gloeophyllum trabeum ATCC 11539]
EYIVEMDACFSQKRRKAPRDPENVHPDTVWLSEAKVKTMEEEVLRRRTQRSRAPPQGAPGPDKDGFEGSLKVPKSALDECKNTFTAADEKRQKASTQLFDDTGIMALNCR